jgi:N-acetylglutamate synthase-like GNAT family acetyltransferase
MNRERPRLATLEDLSEIAEVVTASYEKYLTRMDKPPAPMERDYAEAIENREIWVVGNPVKGLVSLINQTEAVLLIENIAVHPSVQGSGLGANSWISQKVWPPNVASTDLRSIPTRS